MQTFLPYPDFDQSAKCLDYRRLGKQRVEAYQLLLLMIDKNKTSWRNHPAFKMWDGHDIALINYGLAMCKEWISRGYKDTLTEKFKQILSQPLPYDNTSLPSWMGNKAFHSSHKSALLFKNESWYSQFKWDEVPKYDYVWPK